MLFLAGCGGPTSLARFEGHYVSIPSERDNGWPYFEVTESYVLNNDGLAFDDFDVENSSVEISNGLVSVKLHFDVKEGTALANFKFLVMSSNSQKFIKIREASSAEMTKLCQQCIEKIIEWGVEFGEDMADFSTVEAKGEIIDGCKKSWYTQPYWHCISIAKTSDDVKDCLRG